MDDQTIALVENIVDLFTRAWIEITILANQGVGVGVALFTRAWIEIRRNDYKARKYRSPSSRGRGLKYYP